MNNHPILSAIGGFFSFTLKLVVGAVAFAFFIGLLERIVKGGLAFFIALCCLGVSVMMFVVAGKNNDNMMYQELFAAVIAFCMSLFFIGVGLKDRKPQTPQTIDSWYAEMKKLQPKP